MAHDSSRVSLKTTIIIETMALSASRSFGNSLDHVEYGLVLVEPEVVVWYGHGLERDLLGVLEERVRPPDEVQPVDGEKPVLSGHVVRQD